MSEQSNAARTPRQQDLRARLDSWDEQRPRAWKPDVGGTLMGEVVRYSQGQGKYGPAHIAIVREDGSAELRAVWLFWAVLLDSFKSERPKPGERIGIRRLEDSKPKGGASAYRRFALVVEREGGASLPDFDALGPAHDSPAEKPPEPKPGPEPELGLAAPNPFD